MLNQSLSMFERERNWDGTNEICQMRFEKKNCGKTRNWLETGTKVRSLDRYKDELA